MQLAEIVRQELQRQEDVYLKDEDQIEKLARAVEACTNNLPDEVGPGFDKTIWKVRQYSVDAKPLQR